MLGCEKSLLEAIQKTVNIKLQTPHTSQLLTGVSQETAAHNGKILASHKFNLKQLFDHNKDTILQYGLEFRPTPLINKIFWEHRYWGRVRKI